MITLSERSGLMALLAKSRHSHLYLHGPVLAYKLCAGGAMSDIRACLRCASTMAAPNLIRGAAPMIRALTSTDRSDALRVINIAARWYREFLDDEEIHDPEMTAADWDRESQRMTWYGAFEAQSLTGVTALEYIKDVALLRHAYILPEWQRQGTGSVLTRALEGEVASGVRIVVGTYRANYKARAGLAKFGYRECADSEAVLRAYYCIPEDRLRASVAYEKLRQ